MMLGLLCGASIGREGPTVQVGASIMYFIGRKSPIVYQQNLLLAGAAAGIAAAFNTPLAGIVFGIEELSRAVRGQGQRARHRLHHRGRRHLARAARRLHLFRHHERRRCRWARRGLPCRSAPSSAACSAACSAGRCSYCLASDPRKGLRRLTTAYPIVFAVLCGLGVALVGQLGAHASFGTGYEQARKILHGEGSFTLLYHAAQVPGDAVLGGQRHPRRPVRAVAVGRRRPRRRIPRDLPVDPDRRARARSAWPPI